MLESYADKADERYADWKDNGGKMTKPDHDPQPKDAAK